MHRKLVMILFLIIISFFPIIHIYSVPIDEDNNDNNSNRNSSGETVCEYPEHNGLKITMSRSGAQVDSSFLNGIGEEKNFYSLVRYNKSDYTVSDDVEYPDDLYDIYNELGECPDNMWVCEEIRMTGSIQNPLQLVGNFFRKSNPAWEFNHRKLYLLTEDKYNSSYLKSFENDDTEVVITNETGEIAEDFYEACGGNNGGIFVLTGSVCAFFGGYYGSLFEFMNPIGDGYQIYANSAECSVAHPNSSNRYNVNCTRLDADLLRYKGIVDEYKGCSSDDNSCKIPIINKLNKKENDLKAICKSMFENYDYNDNQGECLDTCLSLKNKINEYRQGTDLYIDYTNVGDSCEIAENIIAMVYNVLKWAKYIAPALVIILSMLDFIKAIASQSDDEMKKAQGKFVKRLIVAALLFLLPFIINFMLKTFGMYNSKCDVNNLFSSSK